MWNFLGALVSPVAGAFSSYAEGKAKIKKAKIEAKVAKHKADAARYTKQAEIKADWDMEALYQSRNSWKDEFVMLIWFLPVILLFIPYTQQYVVTGFAALNEAPYGYWLVLFGVVANVFGLRWLFQNKIEKAISSMRKEKAV